MCQGASVANEPGLLCPSVSALVRKNKELYPERAGLILPTWETFQAEEGEGRMGTLLAIERERLDMDEKALGLGQGRGEKAQDGVEVSGS